MNRIDVDAVMDVAPLRGVPRQVACCVIAILVLDGLDIQVISLVAPALLADLGMDRRALGPVFSAALIGMALGAFLLGAAGDRWGRRPLLLASTALFAFTTTGAAFAGSAGELMAWRFVTGIGLGGALPNAMALLAEYAPRRWRNLLIALAGVGVPLGGMIGAAMAGSVVPVLGWRAMFVLAGLLPMLALLVLALVLPESPRHLMARGNAEDRVAALLNRIVGEQRFCAGQLSHPRSPPAGAGSGGVGALFARDRLRDTLGLWLLFFTNLFSIYTFFSWAPVILVAIGLPLAQAVRGALVFNLAGVAGGLGAAWSLGRLGSRATVSVLAVLAGAALLVLAREVGSAAGHAAGSGTLFCAVALSGFALIGIQTCAFRLGAHIYPVTSRARGIGWAAGVGRLGSILSALTGGALLAALGAGKFFLLMALIAVAALAGARLIARHAGPEPASLER